MALEKSQAFSRALGFLPIRLGNDRFIGSGSCELRSSHVERCNFDSLLDAFRAACGVQMEVGPGTPSFGAGSVSLMLTFSQSYPAILVIWSVRPWESARPTGKVGWVWARISGGHAPDERDEGIEWWLRRLGRQECCSYRLPMRSLFRSHQRAAVWLGDVSDR